MSQPGDDGSNTLRAPAFVIGITALILTVLSVTKQCGPDQRGRETLSRNYRGSNDPPEARSDTGEEPRMCDVCIVSWCTLCSQPGSQSERLGISEGQSEEEKRSGWAEFLPLSADKVSDADTDVSSLQATNNNPVQSISSTRIQISAIILMPAPRPTSPPSTSSPNPASRDICDPPKEYALGTSYVPYTSDD